MLSIGEIASRDGVTKPGVSRRVSQLRERGLEVELDQQGRVAKVNSVQYDELRQRFADPSKAQAPRPVEPSPLVAESYDEALRRKTWAEATRSELRLKEEQGQLIRTDRLADALSACSERIVRAVERQLAAVDDMAASVAKDGVSGLRAEMKKLVHRTRSDIADALADIASTAPETEPDDQP
ncbi:ArsR family transcriptional regulator [Reyranella sp.]|uniref:ArsR family transcriptional regulator n=1 Tax=Reyranella sp. TaxID=1929291 RepID=UPI003D152D8E